MPSMETLDMPKQTATIDLVFHALGDPTRRFIVRKLSNGPLSVSLLAAPLAITVTAVAQHLQILEQSGLVRTAKAGRVRTCCIEARGFDALEEWIKDCRSLWERKLDRLGDLLADLEEEPK